MRKKFSAFSSRRWEGEQNSGIELPSQAALVTTRPSFSVGSSLPPHSSRILTPGLPGTLPCYTHLWLFLPRSAQLEATSIVSMIQVGDPTCLREPGQGAPRRAPPPAPKGTGHWALGPTPESVLSKNIRAHTPATVPRSYRLVVFAPRRLLSKELGQLVGLPTYIIPFPNKIVCNWVC